MAYYDRFFFPRALSYQYYHQYIYNIYIYRIKFHHAMPPNAKALQLPAIQNREWVTWTDGLVDLRNLQMPITHAIPVPMHIKSTSYITT